ncbi:hypothetical protein PSYJYH_000008 [Bacillus phage PSYJ-YH]|nr:hypothetical protein PSYJYH_000008 [Bacillus phage PSYJ-YH]
METNMNIQLGENFKIISNEYNIILQEKYEKEKNRVKTGEYGFKDIGYYPTLDKALKGFTNKSILKSEATSLEELSKELKEIKKII